MSRSGDARFTEARERRVSEEDKTYVENDERKRKDGRGKKEGNEEEDV